MHGSKRWCHTLVESVVQADGATRPAKEAWLTGVLQRVDDDKVQPVVNS